jgi:hypothetical protein
MHDTGQPRFFVTVSARRADDMRRLQSHGMDLFASTARQHKLPAAPKGRAAKPGRAARPFVIEGLLDEAQIEKLRSDGYDVTIDAPMEERSVKPGDTLEIEAWHARMREVMAKDREVK